ncbi:MAG: hypothetical protein ABJF10_03335 [Chthoniobacter sp.]|uniref:hypothetical protein n=1 Tax=Chthoniobacter sp. TaxID=2510640 RepID=UPI0032A794E3
MKFFFAPLLSVFALAFMVTGCQRAGTPPDKAVLFQTIEDNVHALEKKDVEAVMATIHPQAPSFDSTREIISEMFKAVDLKYTLSDLKVVTANPDEARVSFVQKTEKTAGEAGFQNNIVQGIHTLRPDNGKWKIYRTFQTSVTGLDGKPLTAPEEAAPEPTTEKPPGSPTPEPSPAPAAPAEPAPKPAAPDEKPPQ